jgi:hypothetical protein
MQIIRVEGDVKKSRVDKNEVSGLPKGLRIKMLGLLNKLTGVKRINDDEGVRNALFELSDRNVTIDFFGRDVKKEFLRTADLLRWYLGRHWYSMSPPGTIGGTIHCADCYYSTVAGAAHTYCPIPSCPSHKKWREVIGPSYKPQKEDPCFDMKRRIAKLLKDAEKYRRKKKNK